MKKEPLKVPMLSHVHKVYYNYTGKECVAGKSYVVNKSGQFYLYMADDLRRTPSKQIIVTNIGGGDLHYLDIESKSEIEIISNGY